MTDLSTKPKEGTHHSPATLGDVLYARAKPALPEQDWSALVQSIASGDDRALHALYERAHRPVFTLMMRITANRETAEELTIDVFHDVWRRAKGYDAANGTVLGWIMNQARSRAIDRLRFETRKKRSNGGSEQSPKKSLPILTTCLSYASRARLCALHWQSSRRTNAKRSKQRFSLGLRMPKPQRG
jgi:RNA polymerase sigma factor (sigma-70 family)